MNQGTFAKGLIVNEECQMGNIHIVFNVIHVHLS